MLVSSCSTVKKQTKEYGVCHHDNVKFEISSKQKNINTSMYEKMTANIDSTIIETEDFQEIFRKSSCSNPTDIQVSSCIKYIKSSLNKKSGIVQQLVYDHLGNIISSSYYSKEPFTDEIRTNTEYNADGNIIRTVDYEKGYNICFHKAMEIAKKVGKAEIKKYSVTDFSVKRIVIEDFPNENPTWIIGFIRNEELELPDEKICDKLEMAPYFYNTKYCRIDGINGKVVSFSAKCITITYDN